VATKIKKIARQVACAAMAVLLAFLPGCDILPTAGDDYNASEDFKRSLGQLEEAVNEIAQSLPTPKPFTIPQNSQELMAELSKSEYTSLHNSWVNYMDAEYFAFNGKSGLKTLGHFLLDSYFKIAGREKLARKNALYKLFGSVAVYQSQNQRLIDAVGVGLDAMSEASDIFFSTTEVFDHVLLLMDDSSISISKLGNSLPETSFTEKYGDYGTYFSLLIGAIGYAMEEQERTKIMNKTSDVVYTYLPALDSLEKEKSSVLKQWSKAWSDISTEYYYAVVKKEGFNAEIYNNYRIFKKAGDAVGGAINTSLIFLIGAGPVILANGAEYLWNAPKEDLSDADLENGEMMENLILYQELLDEVRQSGLNSSEKTLLENLLGSAIVASWRLVRAKV
jgi:hypothetical protein